ncbi:DUF6478 family protein [Rhodovulum euryhalinum]|uniref:Uncharacterized protein n=1 Tax=Rhodovulum euryhalinum TaxID=35805 RepID=A0A4R2KRB5_9RHOB|nr:DUF6478 family protein [Rhodovulum euryhalinum]TCO73516.1 hypothetical protein EV655_102281 [Rhodovulum euryhalinum]
MQAKPATLFDRFLFRHALAAWGRAADRAGTLDVADLRPLRARAAQLRRRVDRVIHAADGRLNQPPDAARGVRRPLGCDWAWRPEIFRGPLSPAGAAAVGNRTQFGTEARIFHDCIRPELTLRQIRNTRAEDLAPHGLRLDVFRFDGTFLSLAIDLPADGVAGLRRRHLIRLETVIEAETPLDIFARLNVRHGPNTEQLVRELPKDTSAAVVEFDLGYTDLNERRVEKMWLDLIFEGPQMNQITLRDVTLSRRPRAEL